MNVTCVLYCRIGPMIAMILIGLGTGGIKPCVSAFGGDQFTSQQVGWSCLSCSVMLLRLKSEVT